MLTIIPAWRYANPDNLISGGFTARTRETDEQYSLEARLGGTRGGFDYVLGGFYYDEKINSKQAIDVSFLASFLDNHYKTRSWAPFARLTAHLSDELRIVGGVRYTRDKKSFVGTTASTVLTCVARLASPHRCCRRWTILRNIPSHFQLPAAPRPLGTSGALIVRADRADDTQLRSNRTTYHAGIEYDVAPQSLAFATVETGYRSGGFSPATGFETYQPEYITAYTAGSKNRFLDNRVQFNAEAFRWNYTNQQISHIGIDLSGRTANFTQNIGTSRIQGVEIEGVWLATRTTLLSADVQYLDAKYLSFSFQQLAAATPPLTGCTSTTSGTQVTVNCSNMPSYNSPRWTVNLAGQQTFTLGNYKIVAGVDTQYLAKRYIGFEYLAAEQADSRWKTNAQLSIGPPDDRWSIAAFVRNIEGKRDIVASAVIPATGIVTVGTAAPRLYGVRGSYKF